MTGWFTGKTGGYTRGFQSDPYGPPEGHTKSVRNQRRMTENYGITVNSSGPQKPYCMNKIFQTYNWIKGSLLLFILRSMEGKNCILLLFPHLLYLSVFSVGWDVSYQKQVEAMVLWGEMIFAWHWPPGKPDIYKLQVFIRAKEHTEYNANYCRDTLLVQVNNVGS